MSDSRALVLASTLLVLVAVGDAARADERSCVSYRFEAGFGNMKLPTTIVLGKTHLRTAAPDGVVLVISGRYSAKRFKKTKLVGSFLVENSARPLTGAFHKGQYGGGRLLIDLDLPAGAELGFTEIKLKRKPKLRLGDSFELEACMLPVKRTCDFLHSKPECTEEQMLSMLEAYVASYRGPRVRDLKGDQRYEWGLEFNPLVAGESEWVSYVRSYDDRGREVNVVWGAAFGRGGPDNDPKYRISSQADLHSGFDSAIAYMEDLGIPEI